MLGLLDDAILIPLGIWLFLKLVPQAIYARNLQRAEEASHHPVSCTGALFIVTFWLLSAALLVSWLL